MGNIFNYAGLDLGLKENSDVPLTHDQVDWNFKILAAVTTLLSVMQKIIAVILLI